jgi:hypothetical protein
VSDTVRVVALPIPVSLPDYARPSLNFAYNEWRVLPDRCVWVKTVCSNWGRS